MQINDVSPVVMFVHNRLDHAKRTIESLSQCYLSDSTELIIYSDGARTAEEETKVCDLRRYLKNVSGFKNVKLIERDSNFGLAKNIFSGVTEVLRNSSSAIIIEDDMIFSRCFLRYMNYNLKVFFNDQSIWQISGWIPSILGPHQALSENGSNKFSIFKSQLMPCWGWATWSDRWERREENLEVLLQKFTFRDKCKFNLDMSYPFYSHLIGNLIGANKTWAIFWYASAFVNNGKSILPTHPLVINVGSDGSGNHTPIKIKQDMLVEDNNLGLLKIIPLNKDESLSLMKLVKSHYKESLSLIQKISMYIKALLPLSFWLKLK